MKHRRKIVAGFALTAFAFVLFSGTQNSSPAPTTQTLSLKADRNINYEGPAKEKNPNHERKEAPQCNEPLSLSTRTTGLVIVLVLIGLTQIFEMGKEHVDEMVEGAEELKPIVSSLWTELTILGFVGVCAFIIEQSGALAIISNNVFGEAEVVPDFVELLHMLLFAVMLIFLALVLLLVKMARTIGNNWKALEINAFDLNLHLKQSDAEEAASYPENMSPPVRYWILRKEFIKPHNVGEGSKRLLPKTFDFALYLNLGMGHILGEMVEVNQSTWFFFSATFIVLWGVATLSLGWFALFICGLMYFLVFLCHLTKNHLVHIRNQLTPRLVMEKDGNALHRRRALSVQLSPQKPTEKTFLFQNQDKEVPPYKKNATGKSQTSAFWRRIYGPVPNKHQDLFLFKHNGAEFFFLFMQITLLSCCVFLGSFFVRLSTWLSLCDIFLIKSAFYLHLVYAVVVIVALVPPALVIGFYIPKIIEEYVVVTHIEMMKNKHHIKHVGHIMKTRASIKALKLLHLCTMGAKKQEQDDEEREKKKSETPKKMKSKNPQKNGAITARQRNEWREIFDQFDKDGGGTISIQELQHLLNALGQNLDEEELKQTLLHAGGSSDDDENSVTFEEFCALFQSAQNVNEDPEEAAKAIFSVLDKDGNGFVDENEFFDTFNALGTPLDREELREIMFLMGADDDGRVDLKEFQEFLVQSAKME